MQTVTEKYMDIVEHDLIEPVRPLLESGVYRFGHDGRVETDLRQASETPWIHIRQDPQRNCALWNHVWFERYGILPSYCQECWKVVVRPTTVEELFMLHELLVEVDVPSKCGIERRYSVSALYGAYLYNDSLEKGLDCEAWIRDLIHQRISKDINVFLKRACTEFEHKYGDSREWKVSPEQVKLERRLEDLFSMPVQVQRQSVEVKRHIMANWIRFAFANGDPTAKQFMTKPLYPPYITYSRE